MNSGKRQFGLAFEPIKVAMLLLVIGLLTGGVSVFYALCGLTVLGFCLDDEDEDFPRRGESIAGGLPFGA